MPEKTDVSENPLKEDKKETGTALDAYSEEDKEYLDHLKKRLERAKRQREQSHKQLNDMTYQQWFDSNEEIANTYIENTNDSDKVDVSAGTVESKLDDILSNINNLNLDNEVFVYDEDDNEMQKFARALQDIMDKTEKEEPNTDNAGDREQRINRQRELLKQGTVFVQEEWKKIWETKKQITQGDVDDFNGEFNEPDLEWEEDLVKKWEGPSRSLLYGPNVYLGDITQFYMDDQPYWFSVKHMPYERAEEMYGEFDNWKYVKPGDYTDDDDTGTIYEGKYRLTDVKEGQVEVIVYQDQPNDEFQVMVNGVLMFPVGFPLSAVTPKGEYNLAKQVYRVNDPHFAYGQSFVSSGSIKQVSKIIDEMLRLFVLKQRKSFAPPRANISGQVIPDDVLNPGRISMGVDPSDIPKLDEEGDGVTGGEVRVLQQMNNLVNESTVSPVFSGQSPQGTQTATESVELQRQAKMTLGLTILSCTLLETKLGYLRAHNILENWFERQGKRHIVRDDGEAKTLEKYRSVNRQDATIEGEGQGERRVRLREDLPDSRTIRELERQESQEKGKPVRVTMLNPEKIKEKQFKIYIETNQSEKESSPMNKMMFRKKLNDIIALTQMGSKPNVSGLEENLANVWGTSRDKLFSSKNTPDLGQLQQKLAEAGPEGGSESSVGSDIGGPGKSTSSNSIKNADQVGQSRGETSPDKAMNSPGNTVAGGSGGLPSS